MIISRKTFVFILYIKKGTFCLRKGAGRKRMIISGETFVFVLYIKKGTYCLRKGARRKRMIISRETFVFVLYIKRGIFFFTIRVEAAQAADFVLTSLQLTFHFLELQPQRINHVCSLYL